MHLTATVAQFRPVFARVAGVAPARSPKPILQNVKVIADDSGVTLMATDLEVGVRLSVPGVTVFRPGSAILPTAKILSILNACKDDTLAFEVGDSDDFLRVTGRQAKYKFPSENPDLFPEVPGFDAAGYHAVAAADLRKLIRRTIFSTDVDSTRYALGGCLIELSDTSATMVGTDGRRLAKMTVPAEAVNGAAPPEGSPVIPVKALKVIDRALDDPEAIVHVAFQPNKSGVLVRTADGGSMVYSRLVEGRFPRYQDVYPDAESAIKIPLDVTQLRQAVDQASIVTSDESRGVDFDFGAGVLTLASQAADVGSSTVSMPTGHDGPAVEITFDPRYLTDALRTIDDGETVTAELIDGVNAAVFRTEDGYSYVVMPLTRDR